MFGCAGGSEVAPRTTRATVRLRRSWSILGRTPIALPGHVQQPLGFAFKTREDPGRELVDGHAATSGRVQERDEFATAGLAMTADAPVLG